jgi:hypothetical protein
LVAKDWDTNLPSWWVRIQDGEIRFLISDEGHTSYVTSSTGATITDSTWKTVKCVRDVGTDTLKIYVNNVLKGTATDTTTGTLDNTRNVRIGMFNDGHYSFKGYISVVKILQPQ